MPDNSRVITWEFTPKVEIPSTATISVLYARAGGPWLTLVSNMLICYCYTDTRKTNHNKYNNDFYRVVLNADTGYISLPQQAGITLNYPYSSEAKNLNRLTNLLLLKTGRAGFLMKRKQFGEKCPACCQFWDDVSVNLHCPVCLGTGIKNGYYKAIPMYILLSGLSANLDINLQGLSRTVIINAKCIAWPIIKYGDIWSCKYTNQRYFIEQVNTISKYKHVPLVYSLKMHLILQSDVIHLLKANQILQLAYISGNSDWEKAFE